MATRISLGNDGTLDPWLNHALREIYNTYGDVVSTIDKAKSLSKHGRTRNADSGVKTTVGEFQGTVVNETFVTTNIIDEIVSTSTADTESIRLEGHTIDADGNLTFVVQNVTLTGQDPVTLATPLARASRMTVNPGTFASPASDLVGTVSVYDNTNGETDGVPTTAAATKLLIVAGANQTEKCATSISSTDYWIMTALHAGMERASGATARADIEIETRDVQGGVWHPVGIELDLDNGSFPWVEVSLQPYVIVPPNHDVRVVATSDTADQIIQARIEGVLAKVQTNDYDEG